MKTTRFNGLHGRAMPLPLGTSGRDGPGSWLMHEERDIGLLGNGDNAPKVAAGVLATHGKMPNPQRFCWLIVLFAMGFATGSMGQRSTDNINHISTVVLDAGHGGKDPGALGTKRYKTTEKDVALAVTLLVGKYLNENLPDLEVIYTRKDDRFVELMERSNIANRNKADLFISIHCNSNARPDPHGCETFVMGLHKTEANMKVAMKENEAILFEDDHELRYDGYDPKDPESMIALSLRQNAYLDHSLLLSSLIQAQFKERVGRVDRGVKQAGFLVISYTTMPAVLVELGFLTNPKEEDFLQSRQGQEYMASAIYRAIKDYVKKLEDKDVNFDPPAVAEDTGTAVEDTGVRFKVQIATTSKRIPVDSPRFKGLQVEEMRAGQLWKYSVGEVRTLAAARQVQQTCKGKGFEGAFITAWKGQERIDLREAVSLTDGE